MAVTRMCQTPAALAQESAPVTHPETFAAGVKQQIDTALGRLRCAARFGTVESVFAIVCDDKSLARFTLRGRTYVDGQWELSCLVHNLETLERHGYAR